MTPTTAKAKAPCIFRINAGSSINDGCTANESGYCHRLDCPFAPGYIGRLVVEEESCEEELGRICGRGPR